MHFFQSKTCFYSLGGEKAAAFLQGIVTCNVETMVDCVYGLMLTSKGRLICDLFIYKYPTGTDFLLEIHCCNREALLRTLDLYNFKKTVTIREVSYFGYIGLFRRQCDGSAVFTEEDALLDYSKEQRIALIELKPLEKSLFCVTDPRKKELGLRIVLEENILPTSDLCYREHKLIRIMNKISETEKEINTNIFPLNYGMEYAFDFNKGCYVGQEVISRFRLRNLVDKSLFCIQAQEGVHLEEGGLLLLDSKVVGHLSSCWGKYGLAMLDKNLLEEGTCLEYKANRVILS